VVHGGASEHSTRPVDRAVLLDMARMEKLAPLHNPAAADWIVACRERFPTAVQLAVFDSGFFDSLPEVAATYALPMALRHRWGLRRIGFHGLAHRSLWRALQAATGRSSGKVITFQLGGGASVAAIRDGQPIDTSMGFSPLEGLVMATRPGDVDAGLILFLLGHEHGTANELEKLLNEQSGLAGISGTRNDLRTLLADEAPASKLAADVYCYRARKYLGAYFAALGRCDAVVFGGGTGENLPEIRARILVGLDAAGLIVDDGLNAQARAPAKISAGRSRIEAWVLATDEESMLAEEAAAWLESQGAGR
jgi:acetate kinase